MIINTQTIVHKCDICGREEEEDKYRIFEGCAPLQPCLRKGWCKIDDELICNKHKITIDGKELNEHI